MSLINTGLAAFAAPVLFVFGLAITHIIELSFPSDSVGFRLVPHVLEVVIALLLILIGYLARTSTTVYAAGMVAYGIDGVLSLLIGSWKGFLVHAIVLVFLYMRLSPELERSGAEPDHAAALSDGHEPQNGANASY